MGAEITDFVFILNDYNAIRTFSESGSITLGGNVSVAAGPIGRNAEASGAASLRGIAAIFSYSQTKGLFAGISLEGSAIVERKDANRRFYGGNVTAKQLLSGTVPPPAAADALLMVLNSRAFNTFGAGNSTVYGDDLYSDMPMGRDIDRQPSVSHRSGGGRRNTWQPGADSQYYNDDDIDRDYGFNNNRMPYSDDGPTFTDRRSSKPPVPLTRNRAATLKHNQAIALYTFKPVQDGDLGFKKGDIITITKRTQSTNVSVLDHAEEYNQLRVIC